MKITTRTADIEDIHAISRLFAESWKYAYRDIVSKDYLDALPDEHWIVFLQTGLSEHTINCLVAEEDGKMIGASVTRKSLIEQFPDDGEIVCFYLLPGQIGKGVGHILFMSVDNLLRESGYTHCVLDVLADNHRAKCFYKKHGFEQTDLIAKATLGNQELACNTMRKVL